jgi:formate dehydrogenase subunit gamma
MAIEQQNTAETVSAIIDELKHKPGALLPILHAIQDRLGFISDTVVPIIADKLLLTRAEVHGVISFYHHFRTTPPGKNKVQICRGEACQAMGSRQLEAHAKQSLNIDYHQTTADRTVSLDAVYCLGNCATPPSIRIGDDIHGRVSPDRFEQLMKQCRPDSKEAV